MDNLGRNSSSTFKVSGYNNELYCVIIIWTSIFFSPDAEKVREATMSGLLSLTSGEPEVIDDMGFEIVQQGIE